MLDYYRFSGSRMNYVFFLVVLWTVPLTGYSDTESKFENGMAFIKVEDYCYQGLDLACKETARYLITEDENSRAKKLSQKACDNGVNDICPLANQ